MNTAGERASIPSRWPIGRIAFVHGSSAPISKAEREQLKEQTATIKQLEKELNRKDKALAETAALLVL